MLLSQHVSSAVDGMYMECECDCAHVTQMLMLI